MDKVKGYCEQPENRSKASCQCYATAKAQWSKYQQLLRPLVKANLAANQQWKTSAKEAAANNALYNQKVTHTRAKLSAWRGDNAWSAYPRFSSDTREKGRTGHVISEALFQRAGQVFAGDRLCIRGGSNCCIFPTAGDACTGALDKDGFYEHTGADREYVDESACKSEFAPWPVSRKACVAKLRLTQAGIEHFVQLYKNIPAIAKLHTAIPEAPPAAAYPSYSPQNNCCVNIMNTHAAANDVHQSCTQHIQTLVEGEQAAAAKPPNDAVKPVPIDVPANTPAPIDVPADPPATDAAPPNTLNTRLLGAGMLLVVMSVAAVAVQLRRKHVQQA